MTKGGTISLLPLSFLSQLCSWFLAAVLASIASDCLEEHNLYRRRYHVPDVKYSTKLGKRAQSLATFMAKTDAELRIQGNVDENLYHENSSLPMTISDGLEHW